MKGIEKVAKTDASGTTYIGRKALRDALRATTFEGVGGRIQCDAYGECAQFKPAVYEFADGDPKTSKIGTRIQRNSALIVCLDRSHNPRWRLAAPWRLFID